MKYLVLAVCLVGCGGGGNPGGVGGNGGSAGNGGGSGAGGGGTSGAPDCGGGLETSCDVPSDNGAHTCSDYVAISAAGVQQANTWCTNPSYVGGTVLPGCCNHDGAIARCVFSPTEGGTSTEWFLSGTVAAAQSACDNESGAFTAL